VGVAFSDIAQFNLDQPDQLEWDKYQDAQAIRSAPPEGIYTVQAPDEILFDPWVKDGRKYLIVAQDTKALVITDEGAAKGYKLYFPFISTRKYAKRMGSQMADYIRGFGIPAQATTNEEYAQLAAATAGRFAKVSTRQEGYCKQCQETVIEGEAGFNGAPTAKCPHCGGTVYATLKIQRFLSALV
jgi:hypothetical protein